MTRTWRDVPGRSVGTKDGQIFFDTDAFPVQYANEADELLLTSQVVTFPDLQKGDAYCWAQWDGPGGNPTESAISVVTIPNQEWGPSAALSYITSGCNLSDVVVGTVPALADESTKYFVKLTRTNAPSNVNGNAVPVMFKEGQWVECYGGSLLVERMYPFARMIQFFLGPDNGDGTRNVVMRRLQSSVKQRQPFYRSGNNYSKTGWNYGGPYGSVYGIPVSQIDTRGPTTDVTGIGGRYRRNGASPASTTDNTDYTSEFTGDIRIVPGRAQISPTSGGGDPNGPYFLFADEEQRGAGDPYTFTSKSIGDAAATRKVFVMIMASGASGRSISSVTIGGIAATSIVSQSITVSTFIGITAIYGAAVPTGDTATIVVDFNGAMTAVAIVVVAGYNLASMSPDATIQSTSVNSNQPLATVAGGFALACAYAQNAWSNLWLNNWNPEDHDLDGIENATLIQVGDPATDAGNIGCRAFQDTDGSTLQIQQSEPNFTLVHAFVAASFH